ncbi:HNH endonuclease [Streptosporangium sp. NPDC000563]|uniref:HNH endonuclease n=1 Tax=Streptosporangium sp. NPDC000563 TaxID=3154366 RepID=UPI003329FFC2
MPAWVLICNPKIFRLHEMLQDGRTPSDWTIGRHRDKISPGDPFVIWLSGSSGGAAAIGEVTGSPHQTAETVDAPYWAAGRAPNGERWVIPIAVTHSINPLVSRNSIKAEPLLEGSTPITQPFATNPHQWSDEQWRRFMEMATPDLQELPDITRDAEEPVSKPAGRRNPNWTWDEVVLACDALVRNSWKPLEVTDPEAAELSRILRLLPIHPTDVRDERFRSTSSIRRKTADLATHHPAYQGKPTNGGETDRKVLKAFITDPEHMAASAHLIRAGLAAGAFTSTSLIEEIDDAEISAPEGRLLLRRHLVRERDRKLRNRKIEQARKTNPDLACESCGFSFIRTYGARGADYIECHHVVPLHASGETRTRLEDLALLCANCHRMIHRAAPWPTPTELRRLIEKTRQVQA